MIIRRLFQSLLALSIFFGVERFCYHQTKGFRVNKILWDPPIPSTTDDFKTDLLDQPFYFFGKGVQFYAFIGADGKTVLKFFKHRPSRPSRLSLLIPGPLQKKACLADQKRRDSLFSSCKLAFEQLKEQTGLLYVQMGAHLLAAAPTVKIFDNLGIAHQIPLAQTTFVLQKRAAPFLDTMQQWIDQHNISQAKGAISSLLTLIKIRLEKGITNRDPLLRNFGILENKVIEIDVGSFKKRATPLSSEALQEKIMREAKSLSIWLQKRSPELALFLKEQLSEAS